MTRKYTSHVAVLFVVVATVLTGTATVMAQTPATQKEPVPDWLAWRVFHESLVVYEKQSPDHVREMLSKEFHLNAKQAAAFQDAGQAYVTAIQQIDADARSETQKRYKDTTVPFLSQRPSTPVTVVPNGPRKSVTQRAKEDGFYAEVEGKKQAALVAHLQVLTENIKPAQIEQMKKYVHASVAPHITVHTDTPNVLEHGTLLPALNSPAGGGK